MNDAEAKTKETYEESAQGLANYFKGIGSRDEDIRRAFQLAQANENSYILELGCGDGRDAKSILERCKNLTAIDYSNGLIEIAKQTNSSFSNCFEVADVRTYVSERSEYDIIFAFASLLHLDPQEIQAVLQKYSALLSRNGVFYVSLKSSEEHEEVIKEDEYGWRLFHYYSPEEILEMISSEFKEVYRDKSTIGSTNWFTLAIQRKI